jgi:hypothetical protein
MMNLIRRLFGVRPRKDMPMADTEFRPEDHRVQDELDHLKETVSGIDRRVSELESTRDPFEAFVRSVRGEDRKERRH